MSDKSKKIVGIAALVLGIPAAAFYGLQWKMQSEKASMHVPETKRFDNYIYMIKDDFVQMVLLKNSDNHYIAVDAANNLNHVREELKQLHIDSSKVVAVFLTHSDGDHVGALSLFPSAKVYLGANEEQMINGKTTRFLFVHNSLNRKDYTLLSDNAQIKIGNTHVKVISTPGHTPGSVSYLVNDSLLFTGDAFGLDKTKKIARPNKFFTMDMNKAVESFRKISTLPTARYLFTSHYGFTVDYQQAVKDGLH